MDDAGLTFLDLLLDVILPGLLEVSHVAAPTVPNRTGTDRSSSLGLNPSALGRERGRQRSLSPLLPPVGEVPARGVWETG